jgi:thiol-disulfide isomerase/thioredoxin
MVSNLGPIGLTASLIVAAVFVVSAVAKLADRVGTRTAVREFGAPASLVRFLAIVLPLAELTVAALLIHAATRTVGGAGALGLLVVFSAAISVRLARGDAPDCHCFGQLHSAPVSWKTLARNGMLAVLAGTALTAGLAGDTPSAVAWIGNLDTTAVLALVTAVTAVALAAGVMAFLSLLRSYGRVLLRLDEFERRLAAAGLGDEEEQVGLPELGQAPGTTAPAFVVAGTDGAAVSLTDLLAPGLPLLLLFTSPSCGPCKALLPDVAAWQDEHADRLTIAIVNSGDREASIAEAQENGLERVIADHDLAVYEAYQASGTPSAVLVASDGTIASYVAAGADSVRQLLDRALAGQGKREEQALPVGSSAPEFILPVLDGEPVNLARVGEETLILFWNPGCGFCSSMRDDLLAWEQHTPVGAPRLLIVSSGDEPSVRAEGFSSTVALDPDFSVGAAFGAGGTPMAILVDSQGRTASPLAAGAEAVFALAGGRGRVDSGPGVPVAVSAKR